jgi:hypothetical protein
MEALPSDLTTIPGVVLLLLIFLDMLAEGKKSYAWFSDTQKGLSDWLKKYFLCLAFLFLAGIAIIYFAVRLPGGTYDSDIDTLLFDALLLPFLAFLLLDRLGKPGRTEVFRTAGFFWGMLIMVGILILMSDEPETWPLLAVSLVATLLGALAILVNRKKELQP